VELRDFYLFRRRDDYKLKLFSMFECNGEGGFLGVLCGARGVCVFFVHVGKVFVRQVRSGA
jgi:hypothetical protein